MTRKLVIATVAAAALIGGGTATAVAVSGDDGTAARRDGSVEVKSSRVTAEQAIAAALKQTPGTAVSADLDDDNGGRVWEVDVLTAQSTWKSVQVDPGSGRVLGTHTDDEDGDDTAEVRAALKGTSVSAEEAARAAATHGTVTSVGLDDETGTWEAETAASRGQDKDWSVDPRSGKVTADRSDDDQDD